MSRITWNRDKTTYLVRILVRPTVNTVVRSVQTTLGEPDDITVLKRAGSDGVEWSIPVQEFVGPLRTVSASVYPSLHNTKTNLRPPLIRLMADSFLVCGPVVVDMGSDMGNLGTVLDTVSDGVDAGFDRSLSHCCRKVGRERRREMES